MGMGRETLQDSRGANWLTWAAILTKTADGKIWKKKEAYNDHSFTSYNGACSVYKSTNITRKSTLYVGIRNTHNILVVGV